LKTTLAICVLAIAGTAPAQAQRDFSKVEIKTTKLAGSVSMLEGAGGNIGVSAGPDGILIVDDQFAPLSDKIRAALEKLGPGGRVRIVLNTHWHGDHTGGNAAFGRDGTIVAQENVRARLATGQKRDDEVIEPVPREALPIVTFADAVSVHFNGEEIRVVHYPRGHTDGDSVVFFTGSNVIHMGDLFFHTHGFPFVDLDSGGDVAGYAKDVEQVLSRIPPGAKIIPGHGGLATVDDLRTFHRMLVSSIDTVRAGIAKGWTLEQIKKAGLPDEWKDWGAGFLSTDTWIEVVHRSLTQKP
jgi:glyoxylase-like metal-dependent hydrolase (beta-lactamase superfamily II)